MTVEAKVVPSPTIQERHEGGFLILSPAAVPVRRRILYVNSYGGATVWNQVKSGYLPSHHLWGVVQLVQQGYEVALAEPLPDFYLHRNPLPHDLTAVAFVRHWLGRDGIVYSGHNTLYWLPFLRAMGVIRCPVVSLLFAREPLAWRGSHAGIIGLTRAASEHARQVAPRAKVANLAWGMDLDATPSLPYSPRWFMCSGVTMRDHKTLAKAAGLTNHAIRVICRQPPQDIVWGRNVEVVRGAGDDHEPHVDWVCRHYSGSVASIIPVKNDPNQEIACGFTELLEAMATGRPVIMTRTGAVPSEIDVEREGIGLWVEPHDAPAMASAMDRLVSAPQDADAMGTKARVLAERHYNIERYSRELHEFFESL